MPENMTLEDFLKRLSTCHGDEGLEIIGRFQTGGLLVEGYGAEDFDNGDDTYNDVQRQNSSPFGTTDAYSELARVLNAAYDQAARGKGADRHSSGQRFEDQPIMTIQELVGPGFALGQAVKKVQESQRMDAQAAQRELLGAINYLAAAYLQREKAVPNTPRADAVGQAIEDTVRHGAGMLRSGPDGAQHVPREEWQTPVSPEENEDIVGHGDNC